jgi:hypothetical protein
MKLKKVTFDGADVLLHSFMFHFVVSKTSTIEKLFATVLVITFVDSSMRWGYFLAVFL